MYCGNARTVNPYVADAIERNVLVKRIPESAACVKNEVVENDWTTVAGQFKSWLRAEGRAGDTSDYIQYLTMAPKSRKVAQLLRIEDNADLD